ncbi:MAG: phage/plasmid primase, P4 family [Muribaculaceae bacterium]|nr:phage/plasmid primase, P4 family [Muribaculaceae bacterium]
METLQNILQGATDQFVNDMMAQINAGRQASVDSAYELANGEILYDKIEMDLMERVKSRITSANSNQNMKKGDPRLPMPKYLDFGQIAQILDAIMTIRVITDGDSAMRILGIYDGSVYNTNLRILHVAATRLNGRMTRKDLDELIARLMLICEEVSLNRDPDLIAVNNGIFDFKKKKLLDFSPKYVFLSKSNVDYRDAAPPLPVMPDDGWDIESWMKDIAVDQDVCQLLWESAGSILRPHVAWNKTIWLYSTAGNNGKGTFCELLRNLLGPDAYVSIPISDFAKDFALSPLIGKQAIITDENDVGLYIDKVAIMKAVVTGDVITINKKYADPVNYRFRGMMVQCLNEYPRVKDKSDSFYRRQVFVPFEKCFTGKENKRIKNEYLRRQDVLEYVLHKLLHMDYYSLSEPDACKLALADYKENNDPVRQFWAEFEDELVWDLVPYPFLFDLYKAWYDQNFPRAQQISRPAFINALKTIVMRESIVWGCDENNKKKYRVGNKMSKPELVIAEYDLKKWMSQSYGGRDTAKKCTLKIGDPLAESYPGIFRK